MKTALLTFLRITASVFVVFCLLSVPHALTFEAIVRAPVLVTSSAAKVTSEQRKGKLMYQVSYAYEAEGKPHTLTSQWYSLAEAQAMAAAPVQIAYARNEPGNAVLKTRLDQPRADDTLAGAIGFALMIGALMGFLITLVRTVFTRRAQA